MTAALLAAGLLAAPAQAQRIIDLETSEGTISVELFKNVNVLPFADLFLANRSSLSGAIFHKSDKNLQCDEDSCSCLADHDCTACQDMMDPFFACDDGDRADCECEDVLTSASFTCTAQDGADLTCPDPAEPDETNLFLCTCDDGSAPKLACEDDSTPPGTCTEPLVQTDLSMPSAALHLGLYRLDDDGDVLSIPDYIPAGNRDDIGIFENGAMTIAFVRDSMGDITSQVVINVEDNSDPFDGQTASDAYLVFGVVVTGQNVVDALSRISTLDLSVQVDDGGVPPAEIFLACSNPPTPLPSWIQGIPDAARCDSSNPWDQFPILDFTGAEPLPRINGTCLPGEVECRFPICNMPGAGGTCDDPICDATFDDMGTPRCTLPLLPECLELGETFEDADGNDVTPCLDPVCDDTFDDMGTPSCTEPLGPNFPRVIPEPSTGLLGAAAVTVVAAIRRSRRR